MNVTHADHVNWRVGDIDASVRGVPVQADRPAHPRGKILAVFLQQAQEHPRVVDVGEGPQTAQQERLEGFLRRLLGLEAERSSG